MNETLQRELDPLVKVWAAEVRRDRAREDVLRARPEQLVDALCDWRAACAELNDARHDAALPPIAAIHEIYAWQIDRPVRSFVHRVAVSA